MVPRRTTPAKPTLANFHRCHLKQNLRTEIVLDLFDAYYERVYAFARKSAGPSIAEDISQEVFVRLLQHPRLEELTLSISYLLKIAHNLLRRRHSRGARLNEILDEHVRPVEFRKYQDLQIQETADINELESAYDQLSNDEQDAIRMIVCEGKSYAHAARSKDVTITTINNWKHRGLTKMRNQMTTDDSKIGKNHSEDSYMSTQRIRPHRKSAMKNAS
jgi:RNA polymerase sigma factor (sigma-70 family)